MIPSSMFPLDGSNLSENQRSELINQHVACLNIRIPDPEIRELVALEILESQGYTVIFREYCLGDGLGLSRGNIKEINLTRRDFEWNVSALENVPDVVRGPFETLRILPGERIELSGMSTSQGRPERSQRREGDAGE